MNEQTYVKYCTLCGAENSPRQAFCVHCLDGDLSIVPEEPRRQPAQGETEEPAPLPRTVPPEDESATVHVAAERLCILELIDDPTKRFYLDVGQTIGRSARADVVLEGIPKLKWISGIHARFSKRGEQWYVQHVGQTNFIKVDGEKFEGQQEVALHDGSILVLSLTSFRVTFRSA